MRRAAAMSFCVGRPTRTVPSENAVTAKAIAIVAAEMRESRRTWREYECNASTASETSIAPAGASPGTRTHVYMRFSPALSSAMRESSPASGIFASSSQRTCVSRRRPGSQTHWIASELSWALASRMKEREASVPSVSRTALAACASACAMRPWSRTRSA